MTSMVYHNRYLGGVPELNMWKERYSKDLRFATVEDLAVQARHGLYPRHTRKSGDVGEDSYGEYDPADLEFALQAKYGRSRRPRGRRDKLTGVESVGPSRSKTSMAQSILDQRPELPALSREAHPHVDTQPFLRTTKERSLARSKSNAGRIPLFASTYQTDFSQPQVDRLDITKERYGMPRDFLVAYREACHTSVGKASLFVKSQAEAGEGLKKFSMMLQPGEYAF